ncbi:uncharacterized protein LOC133716951 [Rosa rugosa]|uniref:uncharacterized protein LOC133716951 n=1 Tax=Rosa rugosa TaxID=74645 RepID=UPI002B410B7A|nr:uncharacterized protein LOC133716951 [Rosa rugosa]
MEDMAKSSSSAWKWCKDRPAVHWSKSHFKEQFKCDILLNNHSESFNKSILLARKKLILGCLEDIRTMTMVRLANRRNSGPNWKCRVGPRVEKLLKKNVDWSHDYRPLESSSMRFEIQGRGVGCQSGALAQHSVQLDNHSCTCRRWDLSGLPCGHAIAAIYSKGQSPDEFVHDNYTQEKYMKAYDPVINPLLECEEEPPAGTEKLPRSYYSQVKCGRCHKKGHNVRTCLRRNQGNVENEQMQGNGGAVNQQQQPQAQRNKGGCESAAAAAPSSKC